MRGLAEVAVLGVALLAAAGCTGRSPQQAEPGPTHSARSLLTGACRVTPVHTGPLPSAMPGVTAGPRRQGTWPWIGGARFAAVLFYAAHGDSPIMYAGGQMPNGNITKILWWVALPRPGTLVIHGREASSGRTFAQSIGFGVGNGQYPSQTVVPSAGCWTLTATIGGNRAFAITVPVAAAKRQA